MAVSSSEVERSSTRAEACSTSITYGKDGKPFFIPGPFDNPARCRQIMNILTMRHGVDGVDFALPSGEGDLSAFDLEAIEAT